MMSKFKVGDVVVRIGRDFKHVTKGSTYVIESVTNKIHDSDCITLVNVPGYYASFKFKLKGVFELKRI